MKGCRISVSSSKCGGKSFVVHDFRLAWHGDFVLLTMGLCYGVLFEDFERYLSSKCGRVAARDFHDCLRFLLVAFIANYLRLAPPRQSHTTCLFFNLKENGARSELDSCINFTYITGITTVLDTMFVKYGRSAGACSELERKRCSF